MRTSPAWAWVFATLLVAGGVGAYARRHGPPEPVPPSAPASPITDATTMRIPSAMLDSPAIESSPDLSMSRDTTDLLQPVNDVERLLDEFDADMGGDATPVDRAALAAILDSTLAGE